MDTLITIFLSLATIFISIYYFIQKPSPATSTAPEPPSPAGRLPIIGHLHLLFLTGELPHHQLARLAAGLGSPVIKLQLGRVPTVVVSSAQLARYVLRVNDGVFANRPQLVAAQYLSFGCSDVTFSPYGPYWRQVRKICVTELLSPRRVHSSQQVKPPYTTIYGEGKKKKELVGVLTETQELLAGFCLDDFFPGWETVTSWITGYQKRLTRNLEDLKEVCDEIIGEHLMKRKDCGDDQEEEEEDFVDVLLKVQRREDLDVPVTDDNLKALVLDMFVAGTDTSSATLEWTMTELARHPTILAEATQEIRSVVGKKSRVDESHLQHLTYMKSVIKEAMRLHPPVPLLVPRESMEDCVMDGYMIPARTRVLINSYAISRDPTLWKDPLEFNPERFLESGIDFHDQEFRFLPFGGGRRGCPGFHFGLATVEIALARLLYHFDWALPDGLRGEDVDLGEIFGLATRKKTKLILVPMSKEGYEFRGKSNT
ncbi:unnamed protein product [Linum tenue]|uniref:Cytochrome P450 n=1 Tax=Linum tenue TaxID=586396 RepID=A0AAV0KUC8_9ROSI|nr:unnamed protein product [Linum tenue]